MITYPNIIGEHEKVIENFRLFYSAVYDSSDEGSIGPLMQDCPKEDVVSFGLSIIIEQNEADLIHYKNVVMESDPDISEKDVSKKVGDISLLLMKSDLAVISSYIDYVELEDLDQIERLSGILRFCYRTFCHGDYETPSEYKKTFDLEFDLNPPKTKGDEQFMEYWISMIYRKIGLAS